MLLPAPYRRPSTRGNSYGSSVCISLTLILWSSSWAHCANSAAGSPWVCSANSANFPLVGLVVAAAAACRAFGRCTSGGWWTSVVEDTYNSKSLPDFLQEHAGLHGRLLKALTPTYFGGGLPGKRYRHGRCQQTQIDPMQVKASGAGLSCSSRSPASTESSWLTGATKVAEDIELPLIWSVLMWSGKCDMMRFRATHRLPLLPKEVTQHLHFIHKICGHDPLQFCLLTLSPSISRPHRHQA